MSKPEKVKVLVVLPRPLLKQLDGEANKQRRDRSSELSLRLQKTFPTPKSKTAAA